MDGYQWSQKPMRTRTRAWSESTASIVINLGWAAVLQLNAASTSMESGTAMRE